MAYGTSHLPFRPPLAPDDDNPLADDTPPLRRGENLFELHIHQVHLTPEALRQAGDPQPAISCIYSFYDFETHATPVVSGPWAVFSFTSQYAVKLDEPFLQYLQGASAHLDVHLAEGADHRMLATCLLKFGQVLDSGDCVHGAAELNGPNGEGYGMLEYWVRLRFPIPQTLRLQQERTKALGYMSANVQSHWGSPRRQHKPATVSLVSRLAPLRKEVEGILKCKVDEEKKTEELQNKVQSEKQKLISEFACLRQAVNFQERNVFSRLEEVDKTIEMAFKATITKLDNKLSSLNKLIMEIEQNCLRQAVGLLQNVVDTVTRDQDPLFQQPGPVRAKQKNNQQVGKKKKESPDHQMSNFRVSFTLDQKTASPQLVLTRDRRSVKYIDTPQTLPNNPERFNAKPCGFTTGRHYWEVNVGGGIYWTVGVARQSIRRKGHFRITPLEGIWAVGLLGLYVDQYWAFTCPDTALAVSENPQRIGVYLDYEQDLLSFYNAGSMEHLFTFTCNFDEMVLPFLLCWCFRN